MQEGALPDYNGIQVKLAIGTSELAQYIRKYVPKKRALKVASQKQALMTEEQAIAEHYMALLARGEKTLAEEYLAPHLNQLGLAERLFAFAHKFKYQSLADALFSRALFGGSPPSSVPAIISN